MLSVLSLAEVGLVTYPWLVTMVTCLQTMSADNKKVRLANLTAAEKDILVELALKYHDGLKTRRVTRLLHISVVSKILTTTNYRCPSLLNSN